jgi:hypothetical protein
MQPLGDPDLLAAYHARLAESHDYTLTAELLDMEENVLGQASAVLDGQVNILPDSKVRRTAQATLLDPEGALELDNDSIFTGSAAANRMLRIRHTIDVPGYGDVTCTPIVGPFSKANRNGDTIDVEVQEKTAISMYGTKPYRVPRGMNGVLAYRALLQNGSGERKFRLPSGNRFRLRKPYSVGWSDEASVLVRATQVAHAMGLRSYYSCDGYATLAPYSTIPVLEFGIDGIPSTSAPTSDADFTTITNIARVEAGKIVSVRNQDDVDSTHPFSPTSMGRNGVPWYRPTLAEVDGPPMDRPQRPGTHWQGTSRPGSKAEWTKYASELEDYNASVRAATARANATSWALLKAGITQAVNINWSCVPVFHLDYGDPIRIRTEEGSAVLRLHQASIPLLPTPEGMTVGLVKPVSRPGRIRG